VIYVEYNDKFRSNVSVWYALLLKMYQLNLNF